MKEKMKDFFAAHKTGFAVVAGAIAATTIAAVIVISGKVPTE